MDAAFLKAAIPEPFTILGKRLKPFCLGHELLLQRAGNSFSVFSHAPPSSKDLILGLFICARAYSPTLNLEEFSVSLRTRLCVAFFGPETIGAAAMRFSEYVTTHSTIPEFYSKDGAPGIFGTPTIQAVKVSLMANLGMSEAEALNTPYSLAFWNHLAWAESQGLIQIVDDEERERQQMAKLLSAKIDEIGRRIRPC